MLEYMFISFRSVCAARGAEASFVEACGLCDDGAQAYATLKLSKKPTAPLKQFGTPSIMH